MFKLFFKRSDSLLKSRVVSDNLHTVHRVEAITRILACLIDEGFRLIGEIGKVKNSICMTTSVTVLRMLISNVERMPPFEKCSKYKGFSGANKN